MVEKGLQITNTFTRMCLLTKDEYNKEDKEEKKKYRRIRISDIPTLETIDLVDEETYKRNCS